MALVGNGIPGDHCHQRPGALHLPSREFPELGLVLARQLRRRIFEYHQRHLAGGRLITRRLRLGSILETGHRTRHRRREQLQRVQPHDVAFRVPPPVLLGQITNQLGQSPARVHPRQQLVERRHLRLLRPPAFELQHVILMRRVLGSRRRR